jgi:Rod binding domain-containing protein
VDESSIEVIKSNLQNIQHTKQSAGGITGSGVLNSKSDIRKVAREMEALFINELMKVMRETTETMSSDHKGLGNETYTGMFDMEVSKIMAERGIGIQDAIVNWFNRSPHNQKTDVENKNDLKKM